MKNINHFKKRITFIKTVLLRSCIFFVVFTTSLMGCLPKDNAQSPPTSQMPNELEPSPTNPISQPTNTPLPTPTNIPMPTPTNTPLLTPTTSNDPQETAVISIPLAGDVSSRFAEISGMAWYGDWLVLLPQYPRFGGGSGEGRLFALSREDIIAYIESEKSNPLLPQRIPFFAPGISQNIPGFEGYEAIIFNGNAVYLTIEASPSGGMTGYIVKGTIAPDLSELHIDPEQIVKINSPTGLPNKSEESIVLMDEGVLTIHEVNGKNVNPAPVANFFNLNLEPGSTIPMTSIEFRITDATEIDENGRFWAINYFYPGEPELFAEEDPIAMIFGKGSTHAVNEGVERLVEFQISDSGIELVNHPPIQLELLDSGFRNWEGISRLDGYGFLLVTDKFPETILGYVPYPNTEYHD